MEESQERAAYTAFILTALISSNGAYHLLNGEKNAVLTQGYYVDHSFMTLATSEKMRSYYDFIVQYMELFYDIELVDVSLTHMGWDNIEYQCFHDSWSVTGEADKLWITLREKDNRKLISLINLCGNDNLWNKGKNKPIEKNNIEMRVLVDKPIKGVYYISPDKNHGKTQELSYERKKTDRGWTISFIVPEVVIWSNIWIDLLDENYFE
jgi:dextranase